MYALPNPVDIDLITARSEAEGEAKRCERTASLESLAKDVGKGLCPDLLEAFCPGTCWYGRDAGPEEEEEELAGAALESRRRRCCGSGSPK